ncbi:hypothetical protein ACI789_18525 [Geodermatophilus sp. SYSU D00965]
MGDAEPGQGRRRPVGRGSAPTFRILFVCTGNVCRSALAERLSRAYLNEVLGTDSDAVVLASAGTGAVVGSGVHPDSALVLTGLGGDPGGFRARQFEASFAAEADLVLVMTRRHRDVVLYQAPGALNRTFTLLEAAALEQQVAAEGRPLPGDGFADRARALVAAMAAARGRRRRGSGDDVPDPIGRPLEVQQEVGETIAGALVPLLARICALRDGPESAAPADAASSGSAPGQRGISGSA